MAVKYKTDIARSYPWEAHVQKGKGSAAAIANFPNQLSETFDISIEAALCSDG